MRPRLTSSTRRPVASSPPSRERGDRGRSCHPPYPQGKSEGFTIVPELKFIAAGLAMGLGAIGPGIGLGIAVSKAMEAVGSRNGKTSKKVTISDCGTVK